MRKLFFIGVGVSLVIIGLGYLILPPLYYPFHSTLSLILGGLIVIGLVDALQTKQTIRRNFPILGNMRYLLELIRPEINQYFIESNTNGAPFNRLQRSLIYQRAKNDVSTLPFGTQLDVYEMGYEWVSHSILPVHVDPVSLRVWVGGKDCKQPYDASILNISAMSYGSLSKNAILALNGGAKDGNFAHNTGEGGLSPYHLEPGGDLIWQIGTGYFGCRTPEGTFSAEMFAEKAVLPQVKMIEIKLSQGAKPGHGGILPAQKVTPEISEIRHVPMGQDVLSPPQHSAFSTPLEMVQFIQKLRDLSGGKPVGFKLCLGKNHEFVAICKAMQETGILPDFITVDGSEGGTGAAPLEFSNSIGVPGVEGLVFVHNCLMGFGLRDQIRVIYSGKITTGFDLISKIAIGADLLNSARAMMISIGCIQALRCNTNDCPTGVATQDPHLVAGLHVGDKRQRVKMFQAKTIESAAEILGAMGLSDLKKLRPRHVHRRVSPAMVLHYDQIYAYLKPGAFFNNEIPDEYRKALASASATSFLPQTDDGWR
ncbi:FMN-binding glutamate synthase family protein [bacterium (Candidatus Blackallbacteria) CG17_big_fil_post_rev_8_21_14_2_50_48_46]|uniref:FMN-binding glutamate synthase family protein n=1 Tax=bacterium (Candidatus Blackallbacteria) CG17_big_fil_post_rev_8_21_14_2_50_48_46 TaxID=2014261 RepID=A0A2M7G3E6_9BACT|nr:MAG: FMN-binding glutamate synthase family protein [bacterium (Candidatus Blackallbacteria) CG18_big_fil_WC_8_21_14_2_50_49_26]PIW16358.1 MAG: FMN-binding glutamate synthase family protein [bacterium (Candidatus Blackallbacteria) CG17_big_fil_post_rev_8_21_14_2_50_48_46]PIW45372.1 MAG: FMN-binding glutamate synthase family protein [bacterium (Candidatus Blackallbacteria) CG13_big_fil_rev_8_21_14_2_50_49_14]